MEIDAIERLRATSAEPWTWFVLFAFLIAVLLIQRRPPTTPKGDQ